MRAFAHDAFTYTLPQGHRFPLAKYRLVRVQAEQLDRVEVENARPATWAELALAHTPEYLERVRDTSERPAVPCA
jgi:acetoin utilization deacetylase AcuC-like enzyme